MSATTNASENVQPSSNDATTPAAGTPQRSRVSSASALVQVLQKHLSPTPLASPSAFAQQNRRLTYRHANLQTPISAPRLNAAVSPDLITASLLFDRCRNVRGSRSLSGSLPGSPRVSSGTSTGSSGSCFSLESAGAGLVVERKSSHAILKEIKDSFDEERLGQEGGIQETSTGDNMSPKTPTAKTHQRSASLKHLRTHRRRHHCKGEVFESPRYVENLETEVIALQARLESYTSPDSHRTQSKRLRMLSTENRSMQQQLNDWETKFEQRVAEASEDHVKLQTALKANIRNLERQATSKEALLQQLEDNNTDMEKELAKKDAMIRKLEGENRALSKRVDIMSNMMYRSALQSRQTSPASDEEGQEENDEKKIEAVMQSGRGRRFQAGNKPRPLILAAGIGGAQSPSSPSPWSSGIRQSGPGGSRVRSGGSSSSAGAMLESPPLTGLTLFDELNGAETDIDDEEVNEEDVDDDEDDTEEDMVAAAEIVVEEAADKIVVESADQHHETTSSMVNVVASTLTATTTSLWGSFFTRLSTILFNVWYSPLGLMQRWFAPQTTFNVSRAASNNETVRGAPAQKPWQWIRFVALLLVAIGRAIRDGPQTVTFGNSAARDAGSQTAVLVPDRTSESAVAAV